MCLCIEREKDTFQLAPGPAENAGQAYGVGAKVSTNMVTKWLHLNELSGDPWILPVWNAVNTAVKAKKVRRLPDACYKLGLHVSTRLNILPRVVHRVNKGASQLLASAKLHGPEHIFTKSGDGFAFPLDNDLKYCLLADIDSLLFELNSACELMMQLFAHLHSHVGCPIKKGEIGKAVREALGGKLEDSAWFQSLDKHRNFFIHEGAPYLAVDISEEPDAYDLLIMRSNVRRFTTPRQYVALSEVNSIVQGFLAAKTKLQKHLISLFT